jgi:hypothetical protein
MPYRIRYMAWIDYLPPGVGSFQGTTYYAVPNSSNPLLATDGPVAGAAVGPTPAGGAQTIEFNNTAGYASTSLPGTGAAAPGGNQLASADITTFLTALSADLSAQMNAVLTRLAQFPNGGT